MGRLRGWRPDWTEALGYYDIVNHAKRVKCPVTISAGLGDYVCPPSGVAILYNNIKSPKSLEVTQGKKHGDFGYKAPKDNQSFKLESK
jgi:cephalosporin-C deacetylase-like acetyl esterase